MLTIGLKVQDPASKSYAVVQRVSEKNPDYYEVRITEAKAHHKVGDVLVWVIKS